MSIKDKISKKKLSEKEIDEIVVSQADDDSAWEEAIETRRTEKSSLAISAELARRAAFLAKLHRENRESFCISQGSANKRKSKT